jgi:hypothetical protein
MFCCLLVFTINHAAMRTLFRPLFVITLNVQLVPRVPQKGNHYRLVEPTVNNWLIVLTNDYGFFFQNITLRM